MQAELSAQNVIEDACGEESTQKEQKSDRGCVMELGEMNKLLEFVKIICKKHQASRARQQNRACVEEDIWLNKLDVNIVGQTG